MQQNFTNQLKLVFKEVNLNQYLLKYIGDILRNLTLKFYIPSSEKYQKFFDKKKKEKKKKKISVMFQALVVSVLLYSCTTWTKNVWRKT